MRLTDDERAELSLMPFGFENADMAGSVENLSRSISDLLDSGDSRHLQTAIAAAEQLKKICQSIHNLNHTLGMLTAKAFLEAEFPNLPWEEIEFAKSPSIPGPDIYLPEFSIVGELKTTEPCNKTGTDTKFGSKQSSEIKKDLRSLSSPEYGDFLKYMFVTTPKAYQCLINKHRLGFPGICFVQLGSPPKVSTPAILQVGRGHGAEAGSA